jgi:hypothetical protein
MSQIANLLESYFVIEYPKLDLTSHLAILLEML